MENRPFTVWVFHSNLHLLWVSQCHVWWPNVIRWWKLKTSNWCPAARTMALPRPTSTHSVPTSWGTEVTRIASPTNKWNKYGNTRKYVVYLHHTCTNLCIYIYIYTHIYIYIYIYICACVCVSLSLSGIQVCMCIYIYIHMYIYICVCACMYVHTYIYICTYLRANLM